MAALSERALRDSDPVVPARAHHPILAFLGRRVVTGLLTVLVVSIAVFAATNILPGNVAAVVLGKNATPKTLHALEVQLHLNRPIIARYVSWLGDLAHGNFGHSAVAEAEHSSQTSIGPSLSHPLTNSLILAGVTTIFLVPLTLMLGMLAGMYAGRSADRAISLPSLVLGGLPEFVTGALLIYVFFTWLKILPPVSQIPPGDSPFSDITGLVLPVSTLLIASLASGIRQVRTGMITVLSQDYVHFARLNGIAEGRVLVWYALRNALATSVQIIAQNLQYLLGGIVIVESVFSYPGIGTYLVNAVSTRDVTEVQAAAIILAVLYIVINMLADLAVVLLVPKLRTGMS